jgi:hypothetical protein
MLTVATKQACVPGAGQDRRVPLIQSQGGMPSTLPGASWSPCQVLTPAGALTGGSRSRTQGQVRSAGVEPATSASSRRPLCQLEYEHMEPIPGADPGRPPYEGGAAAVRIGMLPGQGLEPQ